MRKNLPELTLDLRRATLNSTPDGVNVVDRVGNVVMNIKRYQGAYDHAGVILDRLNTFPILVTTLRALSIVEIAAKMQNAMVPDGHRCRVCLDAWTLNEPERHTDGCPLKGSEE